MKRTSTTYKELDRPYIAKQLNGSIITSFIKAVYNYFHKDIDESSEYLRNLSIETADTEHLITIGKLMGVQLFSLFTDAGGGKYLTFQLEYFDTSLLDYNDGWSAEYKEADAETTGVFGTGAEGGYPIPLSDSQYAAILNAVAKIPSAAINSIYAIDTILYVLTGGNYYTIGFNNTYPDVIDVNLSTRISVSYVALLQNVFDRLFKGGVTILVTRRS